MSTNTLVSFVILYATINLAYVPPLLSFALFGKNVFVAPSVVPPTGVTFLPLLLRRVHGNNLEVLYSNGTSDYAL